MSKIDIWVCAGCHNVFNDDKHWTMGGYCTTCSKKKEEGPTKFHTNNWKKYLEKIKDKEWTHRQQTCTGHNFERVPKSGMHLGISLWRCIHCEAVTQST